MGRDQAVGEAAVVAVAVDSHGVAATATGMKPCEVGRSSHQGRGRAQLQPALSRQTPPPPLSLSQSEKAIPLHTRATQASATDHHFFFLFNVVSQRQ